MKDIKKRFIDILFETDDEDEEEVVPAVEPVKEPVKKEPVKTEETSYNAKDVLYRKSDKSAFIDLEETIKTVKQSKPAEEEYELSSQISPIFGLIKENKQTIRKPEPDHDEALINKPDDSHLEIITSPIYGYGSREDAEKTEPDIGNALDATDEDELHRLLDEDFGYDDHTYDDIEKTVDEINLFDSYDEED